MDFWDELYNKHFRIWEHPSVNTEEVSRKQPPIIVEETVATPEEPQPEIEQETGEIETVVEAAANDIVKPNDVEAEKVIFVEEPESKPEVLEEIQETKPQVIEKLEESKPQFVEETQETKSHIVDEPRPIETVHLNGNSDLKKPRTSNEIKMVQSANGAPKDVIRANDPPEDDLPKNIGVNKFVNFFESLGGKK